MKKLIKNNLKNNGYEFIGSIDGNILKSLRLSSRDIEKFELGNKWI